MDPGVASWLRGRDSHRLARNLHWLEKMVWANHIPPLGVQNWEPQKQQSFAMEVNAERLFRIVWCERGMGSPEGTCANWGQAREAEESSSGERPGKKQRSSNPMRKICSYSLCSPEAWFLCGFFPWHLTHSLICLDHKHPLLEVTWMDLCSLQLQVARTGIGNFFYKGLIANISGLLHGLCWVTAAFRGWKQP